MLVRRKRSGKRKRKFYEALEFTYPLDIEDVKEFLGDLGKVNKDNIWHIIWIETKDGRKISTGQYLLKDDRRKRILSFNLTIFHNWFDIWRNT